MSIRKHISVKLVSYRNKKIDLQNKLAGFYTTWDLTKRCFQTDYNFNSNYNFIQRYGVEIRGGNRRGKIIFIRDDNTPLNTINCFLSSNNNVYSLIYCIEFVRKGVIVSHIQVTESFNLRNSIKWIV